MMQLSDRVWKPFRLLDYFDYKRGDQKDMNSLLPGDEMLVSARNVENGLKGFYRGESSHKRFAGDCLTLNNDGDGGVGLAYYQPHEFLLDTHVYALYSKKPLSRFAKLFISRSISMCRPCFSHGHSISKKRLRTLKVMLPVNAHDQPDYAFMEAFIKEREKALLTRYKAFVAALYPPPPPQVELKALKPLSEAIWRAFLFAKIFRNSHGRRLAKANRETGNLPLLTAGATNNGVAAFISSTSMPLHSHFISVDMFGTSFAHPYTATGDDNIYFFENSNLNDAVKHFISVCINKQSSKYSYGKQFRQTNADKLQIMLPMTPQGNPDFAFMDAYGRKMMRERIERYLAYRAS